MRNLAMTLSSAQLCRANEESKTAAQGSVIIDRSYSVDTFNEVYRIKYRIKSHIMYHVRSYIMYRIKSHIMYIVHCTLLDRIMYLMRSHIMYIMRSHIMYIMRSHIVYRMRSLSINHIISHVPCLYIISDHIILSPPLTFNTR